MIYSFPLMEVGNFCMLNEEESETGYLTIQFDDYEFVLCDNNNDILNQRFDIIIMDFYSLYDNYYCESPIYYSVIKTINKNKSKLIILDIEGEYINHYFDEYSLEEFQNEVVTNKGVYFISQRHFINQIDDKILTNQYYLPLLYYYYHLSDNLFLFPSLYDFENKNKKYDFITYTGLKPKTEYSVEWRHDIIEKIDFKNKSILLPKTYNEQKISSKKFQEILPWPNDNFGSYFWYSLLESEQAKIKIVFESTPPGEFESKWDFLTEKTLKCFLHNQPYILFLSPYHRKYFENMGFQFVGPSNKERLIEYISDLSGENIDNWIDKYRNIFSNNKNIMNELIYRIDLEHINLLLKVLK